MEIIDKEWMNISVVEIGSGDHLSVFHFVVTNKNLISLFHMFSQKFHKMLVLLISWISNRSSNKKKDILSFFILFHPFYAFLELASQYSYWQVGVPSREPCLEFYVGVATDVHRHIFKIVFLVDCSID